MTGLDVEKEVIIEAAAIITDLEFNRLDEYHAVVNQPQSYIDAMDAWNKEHHGKSGLIDLIPKGKAPEVVEKELCALARKHFPDQNNRPVIAGNTIYQDRTFINKYFLKFADLLHYRMLDVSAWKIIMVNKFGIEHQKTNQHRALDDIVESIEELKAYIKYVKV